MSKHLFLLFFVAILLQPLSAQKDEWHNSLINEVNRLPMHTDFFAYETRQLPVDGKKNNHRFE